ncbi:MAG TPA: hypothetical protein DHV03_07425 [Alphaproteobacteria bacterium]|nr:hypothetical protein [Alphaproteobacteria bacterium]
MSDIFRQKEAAEEAKAAQDDTRRFRQHVAVMRHFGRMIDEECGRPTTDLAEKLADIAVMHGLKGDVMAQLRPVIDASQVSIAEPRLHELLGQARREAGL